LEYQNVLKPTLFIGSFEIPEAQHWGQSKLPEQGTMLKKYQPT